MKSIHIGLCLCLGITFTSVADSQSNDPKADKPEMKPHETAIKQLRGKIKRLENDLSNEKDRLHQLLYKQGNSASQADGGREDSGKGEDDVLPGKQPPKGLQAAVVLSIQNVVLTLNRGKRDGFHLSDKLLFTRKTSAGELIVGRGEIGQVYNLDLVAHYTSGEVRPEDKAYIINRDNTPYNIGNPLFRIDR